MLSHLSTASALALFQKQPSKQVLRGSLGCFCLIKPVHGALVSYFVEHDYPSIENVKVRHTMMHDWMGTILPYYDVCALFTCCISYWQLFFVLLAKSCFNLMERAREKQ